MLWPSQRLVALHIPINIGWHSGRDLMYPLGARTRPRRSHARDKSLLLAEADDFIRIGGDDDLVQRRTPPHSLIHPRQQWDAGDLAQHLAGQARRSQPRRNHSDNFHAPSFAWRLPV